MTTNMRWLRATSLLAVLTVACSEPREDFGVLYRAPEISNVIDGVVFESGNWEPHLAAGQQGVSWGNHRAVVVVDDAARADDTMRADDAVMVTIPWRRHDPDPSSKAVVVVDARTGEAVDHVLALRVERESGDIIFEANDGSDTYHVYYMPWESTGGNYPTVTSVGALSSPDPEWASAVRARPIADFAIARTTHIQSVDDFHSFFPMEVIASEEAAAAFMATASDGWALVPEYRDYPVRMRSFLPQHWPERGQVTDFESRVLRGESFALQLVVVAGGEALEDVEVSFDGFPAAWTETLTCLNCGGIDEKGEAFEKRVRVGAGSVQPLWILMDIPDDEAAGTVTGDVTVTVRPQGSADGVAIAGGVDGLASKTVRVTLDVQAERARNRGYDTPELMTRLAWLNSTVGTDPDFIIEPFEPVRIEGRSLKILGRRVELGASGLPDGILSYFTPELTSLRTDPEPILARPMELEIRIDGAPVGLEPAGYTIRQEARGRVSWEVANRSDDVEMIVAGALEYDGMLDYRITVRALADLDIDDVVLPVVLEPGAARYMLGLGRKGGERPATVDWRWKVENHQEGVWLGGVHKGLQYVLRDDDYVRPLNTNFYLNQPLRMPTSWFNEGRGGIRIKTNADAVTATNYSGPRTMAAGDELHFNVRFLITPFKPIDTGRHFRTRFVHKYVPVDSVAAWGGTVVNIHHANEINPYINYPFFNLDKQTAYIEEAHSKGIKVKLYDTIRELTYHAYELFALRSLGDEILNGGEGGGHSWMQEHLESDYHSAWHAWRVDDAAMLDKGTSRWTNYYIEGLSWLAENQEIDGLYLDDIAFSRETVKRMMSVLHEQRDEVVIDLHSANQFNPRDGYTNSAMLYMEHFPFISRLWFGEYFEYDRDEDYWMTEVSGLPFGLMGEMLQDGGHPYRGMLYGMTARMYGDVDPRPVWRMMDDFGIEESRMLGYWLDDAPVRSDHARVLATTFVRPEGILIALASWSDQDETVDLSISDDLLPGGRGEARATAPAVEGLQAGGAIDLSKVRVPANQGLFIVLERGVAR